MKCSKCGRFTKGHPKPLGDLCTLPPMTQDEIDAMKIVEAQPEKTDTEENKKTEDVGDNLNGAAGGDSGIPGGIPPSSETDSDIEVLEKELGKLQLHVKRLNLMTAIEMEKRKVSDMSVKLNSLKDDTSTKSPVGYSASPTHNANMHEAQKATLTDIFPNPGQHLASSLLSQSAPINPSSTAHNASRNEYPRGFGLTGSVNDASYLHTGKTTTKYKKILDYVPNISFEGDDEDEEFVIANGVSLKLGPRRNKLASVTPTQWMVANTKIFLMKW